MMISSDVIRKTLPLAAVLIIAAGSNIFVGAEKQPVITENEYTEHLQDKLLKVYFPPRGPFNFAESEIKVVIKSDGKAKLESILQPPMVRNKRSAVADGCLKAAVENINPFEPPPVGMKPPTHFSVKFIRQKKGNLVFRCLARKL